VPIGEALARCTAHFAERWWHWFFLGQTAKPAERVINLDPAAWYGGDAEQMGRENFDDFRRAIHDPATVHAMCEDYRAGLGLDRQADDADRQAGRTIDCPVLLLWAAYDDLADLYGDPLEVWRAWAPRIGGRALASGHHLAEEVPEELAAALADFFAS
jgi:haloacetate dehalogenase